MAQTDGAECGKRGWSATQNVEQPDRITLNSQMIGGVERFARVLLMCSVGILGYYVLQDDWEIGIEIKLLKENVQQLSNELSGQVIF